jgi:MFS family permease
MSLNKLRIHIGFVAATLALLVVFAASAAPIPLYDLYRREDGLSYPDLALTAVVYFIGAISALLIFGRISNHLGRKPVIFLTFALAAVVSILFLDIDSATPLIIGRFLLGVACGLASSTIASYIIDNAGTLPKWLPAAVVGNSPMVGLTIGSLTSGTLVECGPYPKTLSYYVVLVGLFACSILIIFSKETVKRTPGLFQSFKPQFSMPHTDKRLYPIAASVFVATWALGGFYQAYGPSIAVSQLGTSSTLIAAIVFSSFMLPTAIGGPLSAKLSPANAQRIGMVIFTLGVGGILVSLKFSSITAFLLSSAVAGAAQGSALTGSIRTLLQGISSKQRAGVLSLIYATSYTGVAVSSFIAGELSHFMNLFQITLCYGVLAVVVCITTLMYARNKPQM